MLRPPDHATLERLKQIVGPAGWADDPDTLAPHLVEWRSRYQGKTPLLLKPGSTSEVAAIVRLYAQADVGIVPQGGNTGLVGAQIPSPSGQEIVLNLARMNRVRALDPSNNTITAEAGCVLAAVQQAAAENDRLFPLSLAAEGSCQIGGNLSANAGGIHVLRYGNSRDLVLGLEVVTAQGEIWDGLRGLRKDNTGYDLKHLYIGSEGTLGIITAAVLKLFPRHRQVETAFAAVPTPEAALDLLALARDVVGDGGVLAFEMISRQALDMVVKHMAGCVDPLATRSPWYALTDLTVPRVTAEAFLTQAVERGLITDAALAGSSAQGAALWKLRESISEAQKGEGGSIKNDISVPVSRIPSFIRQALAAVEELIPGIRPVPFGHVGDGNLHFNFSQPVDTDQDTYLARWEELNRVVNAVVAAHGGSISAEHGIGVAKRAEARRYKSAVELDLMRRIKQSLDPKGIMNPGKGVV